MNLTDLQKELRALEGKLSALQVEIEGMKPKAEDAKKQDFERITKLAAKHRLDHVAIAEASEYLIKKYIRLLSFVLSAAEKGINEKLLYLMRIISSTKMKWTVEEAVQFGIEFDVDEIEETCRELGDYKYVLLADALIMVNFAEEGSQKEISLVADIAKFLNVDRDDLEVISKVVHSYLTNDYEPLVGYIGNGKKLWGGVFRQYIPLTWLEKQRVEVLRSNAGFGNWSYPFVREPRVIQITETNTIVKRNKVLLTIEYRALLFSEKREETLSSPTEGLLHHVCTSYNLIKQEKLNSNAEMYIVSIFDELDVVDEWIKSKKKA